MKHESKFVKMEREIRDKASILNDAVQNRKKALIEYYKARGSKKKRNKK